MTSILDEYPIFRNVQDEFKRGIKAFHVFKPPVNAVTGAMIITADDSVYAIGYNKCGILGLGYNQTDYLADLTLVEELSGQSVIKFIRSDLAICCFALTKQFRVFVWGVNTSKLSEVMPEEDGFVYLRPKPIEFFDDKQIIEVSAVASRYLALSTTGQVFLFNDDHWIRGKHPEPELLHLSSKVISTSISLQFAIGISQDSTVLHLAHSIISSSFPESREIYKIQTVAAKKLVTTAISLFVLNEQGEIYQSELDIEEIRMYKVDSTLKFIDIWVDDSQLLCQTDESVHVYQYQKGLISTKNINLFEFYLHEYRSTHDTIHINNRGYLVTYNQKLLRMRSDKLYWNQGKLRDQFKIIAKIGEGNFSRVHKVEKLNEPGKELAVKMINIDMTYPDDKYEVFREIRHLEQMDEFFVSKIVTAWLETSSSLDFVYILMEYCDLTLEDVIHTKPHVFGRLVGQPLQELETKVSIELFKQLIRCVDYMHSHSKKFIEKMDMLPFRKPTPTQYQPLLHRDIKPANILVGDHYSDGQCFVKLCDFGLTTDLKDELIAGVGADQYMAPEVIAGNEYDLRADIYSLGVIAQQLFDLNGAGLHTMSTSMLNLSNTVSRMLAENPENRPSCKEISDSLDTFDVNMVNLDMETELSLMDQTGNGLFTKIIKLNLMKEKTEEKPELRPNVNPLRNIPDHSFPIPDDLDPMPVLREAYQGVLRHQGIEDVIGNMTKFITQDTFRNYIIDSLSKLLDNLANFLTDRNTIDERRFQIILDENDWIRVLVKMIWVRLDWDALLLEKHQKGVTIPSDIELYFLSYDVKEISENLQQIHPNYQTIESSQDIFDAVIYPVHQSKAYSIVLRYMTMLIFLKNRDKFEYYCEIYGEGYQDNLLKILSNKPENRQISMSNSGLILALQLAMQRPIHVSWSADMNMVKYSINGKSRDPAGRLVEKEPVIIFFQHGQILSLKQLTDKIQPSKTVPDEEVLAIFGDLSVKCEVWVESFWPMFGNMFQQLSGRTTGLYEIKDIDLD